MKTKKRDGGFLNLYSSVLEYELSKNPDYKASGLMAVERLKVLFNPNIGLVSFWGLQRKQGTRNGG
jgi:hypothetical protein